MATLKYSNRNVINTDIGGEVKFIDSPQFVEISFGINSPSSSSSLSCLSSPNTSIPSSEDLPGSICPVCGSVRIDISNGHGHCNYCGAQMSLGLTVTSYSSVEEFLGITEEKKQQYPIVKYKDIVSDRKNRFKILDL